MRKSNSKISHFTKLFFTFWIIYFLLFWLRGLWLDESGNLVAGHPNIWADWAVHFTFANAMAERSLFLEVSPLYSGAPFSYHFFADLISALLLKVTNNWFISFIIPSFLFSITFIGAVFYFFNQYWQSQKKAILSSIIFVLNGGLGFYFLLHEAIAKDKLVQFFLNPKQLSTWVEYKGIKWISIIDSMLIPQRAFALGFPLGLIALTTVYQQIKQKKLNFKNKSERIKILGVSLTFGFMPVIHAHTFIALFIIMSCWMTTDLYFNGVKKRIKYWLYLACTTAIVALPVLFIFFTDHSNDFIRFYPGWLAKDFHLNWFIFWLNNWGLVAILAPIGLFLAVKKNKKKDFFLLPFILIFLLANIVIFQPYAWDNTKLFAWASLGTTILVLNSLEVIYKKNKKIAVILFCATILSGLYDLHYTIRTDLHNHVMYNKEELDLSKWVKENTPTEGLWLSSDKHNHFIYNLTGRQTLMAYRGWLFSHGYDYKNRESNVKQMFSNPSENLHLYQTYDIDYVVVGPDELSRWNADEDWFLDNLKLIKESRHYKIFQNQYN